VEDDDEGVDDDEGDDDEGVDDEGGTYSAGDCRVAAGAASDSNHSKWVGFCVPFSCSSAQSSLPTTWGHCISEGNGGEAIIAKKVETQGLIGHV
jgi:hypothetical protein